MFKFKKLFRILNFKEMLLRSNYYLNIVNHLLLLFDKITEDSPLMYLFDIQFPDIDGSCASWDAPSVGLVDLIEATPLLF